MAIIKCPECGQNISDEASVCPHCGCTSIAEKRENNFVGTIILIGIVAFISIWLFAPASVATVVIPLIMLVIGLLIKNKVGKWIFIIWAVWTFLANIGNL